MRTLFFFLLLAMVGTTVSAQDIKPITKDAFLNQPFGFEQSMLKLTLFGGLKFKVTKEAVPNLHNPEEMDTIYHLKKGKNTIDVFKNGDKTFVYQAFIKSKKANLASGIHPGMSRADFYQTITDTKDLGTDIHKIHNSDKSATATVRFKKDKVKSIALSYSVD